MGNILTGYFQTPTAPNGLTACRVWRARLTCRREQGHWPPPTPSLWGIEAAETMDDLRAAGRDVGPDEREICRAAYVRRRKEIRAIP